MLLLHQCRERREQVAGIEPAIPVRRTGVSPQHFTCGGVQGTPDDRRPQSEDSSRGRDRIVGRVGIEPTSGRIKNPLQGQHLLPTPRTHVAVRLSSHPLESNQDLSGFSRARRPHAPEWVIRVPAPAGTHVNHLFGCQGASAPTVGSACQAGRPPAGLRHFSGAAVLGPGFEPGSGGSEPSVVPSWTSPVCQSRIVVVRVRGRE